jgi:hypothetical protein
LIDYINANDPHAWADCIKRVIQALPQEHKIAINNYNDEWKTLWYKIIDDYKKKTHEKRRSCNAPSI